MGAQCREDVDQAFSAIRKGDTDAASAILATVRNYCDALQQPNRPVISVATTADYDAYMSTLEHPEPTEWIDIACPSSYTMTGYMHAGLKQMDEALRWLDKARALAPYYPEPLNERGFVLGQLGRFDEALAAYRSALAIADAHPSAVHAKPLSLRGIGYVSIEMGDLDAAQQAYEDALRIDPDNALAKKDLDYIARQRTGN